MSSPTRKTQVTNVIQVSSGNFLEMYDFMAFGYFASAIGETYFPTGDHFASLMSSLMTFGVGFLMRPIGALILGAYIDRYGRRTGLILTLALMSVGTFGLAFTPGFAVIGIAAPLFIVFSRLLQGFSAGVELGGAFSLAYSLATALFGGFTPAICESLIKATGNRAMPGLWMSTAAAIGLVATLLIIRRQKRGVQESTDGAWGTVERGSPNA